MPGDAQGCLAPITIDIPSNSLLKPSPFAAVVGGNVLTSQRVTDVVLKAFNAAAASQAGPLQCIAHSLRLIPGVPIAAVFGRAA